MADGRKNKGNGEFYVTDHTHGCEEVVLEEIEEEGSN